MGKFQKALIMVLVVLMIGPTVQLVAPMFSDIIKQDDTIEFTGAATPVPSYSATDITDWAAMAATDTMSFGFHNIDSVLPEKQKYFTTAGWKSFSKALNASRIPEMIKINQQVLTASLGESFAPYTEPFKDDSGVQKWQAVVPLQIHYQAGSKYRIDNLKVHIILVKRDDNSLAITQFIAMPQ